MSDESRATNVRELPTRRRDLTRERRVTARDARLTEGTVRRWIAADDSCR